jgi:CBS domain-containing membrane protein
MHIVELVPLLSEYGLHHIPIIDGERCLVDMATNSDLVAGLYRERLVDLEERQ